MMKLLLPLCFVSAALGPRFIKSLSFEPQDRIVGGSETSITDFPYMASIAKKGKPLCGGSIISENYILTAAHCFYELSATYTVRVGSTERQSGGTVFEVKEVITHPKNNPGEHFDYDIALLELNGSIKISPTSQPVDLPDEGTPVEEGEVGVIAGWGSTDTELNEEMPSKLHQVSVTVSDTEHCNSTYWGYVTPRMFCTGEEEGGRDACLADDGGPFVINDTQIGILSYGQACGEAGVPRLLMKVPSMRSWISEIAGV